MFERFTQRALRSIVLAQEEARGKGHVVVDVGHLGLGALATGSDDGPTARLRHALRLTIADLPIDEDHTGHVPFTPDSKDLLERGLERSVEHGRDHVSSRDLLAAALTNPRVAAALAAAGTGPDEIRTALDADVPGPDDVRPGPPRAATSPRGRGSR